MIATIPRLLAGNHLEGRQIFGGKTKTSDGMRDIFNNQRFPLTCLSPRGYLEMAVDGGTCFDVNPDLYWMAV